MITVTAFINARLDEDEAIAKTAGGDRWAYDNENRPGRTPYVPQAANGEVYRPDSTREYSYGTGHVGYDYAYVTCDREGILPSVDADEAEHIARHDPARVLRQCAAIRAALESIDTLLGIANNSEVTWGTDAEIACEAIASIWSDHPDFDRRWKI
ncbi:hypothetical protein A5780_19290 [Nocardia sp. 852002-20019_SCH5090214]|uniref:DUF6221 family protein n=1 Tax=Nocardia sp. 852002-20019_SCH5090214 TaxID=1834087 RepID=UPI0007EB7A12|nr:DUF6221 family protein [Nocardia sp. 852002-20019_SCH5090214]OBA62204.1 hypothetical protein A5780_19290 [Nocardia sp. 852002-20019_SCH5090214]